MLRTQQGTIDKSIENLRAGEVLVLKDTHDIWWDYFFACGNSFVVGQKNKWPFKLFRPDKSIYFEGEFDRIIPHPDGPIIERGGELIQDGKPLSIQCVSTSTFSIANITRTPRDGQTTRLVVNNPNGGECADLTAILGITDYQRIEVHRKGLLVNVENSVWLVATKTVSEK